MAQQETARMVNGMDLDTLQNTVNAIEQDPELGKCRFRATNRWINGCHNRTTIDNYYAAKEERTHRQTFELDADGPPMLAGDDYAPNPMEHLLNALAACVTASIVAHAAVRGIHIEELESELEGDIDLSGFLGVSDDVPKGYTEIRVKFRVKAGAENLERLRRLADYSPVYSTLIHGTNVEIEVEPM